MARSPSTTLAFCAAMLLAFGSIGALVTVPPVQAETPTGFALPVVA